MLRRAATRLIIVMCPLAPSLAGVDKLPPPQRPRTQFLEKHFFGFPAIAELFGKPQCLTIARATCSLQGPGGSLRLAMAEAIYKILAHNSGWGVFHDGTVSGDYLTKEAAFEAAVGPASNAIKNGQTVTITVEGSESGEPSWAGDEVDGASASSDSSIFETSAICINCAPTRVSGELARIGYQ